MINQFQLPALGENIQSCEVLTVLVREGDVISREQDLLEVETDKATIPIPSPGSGRVVRIHVNEGQTLEIGCPLCDIEDLGDESPRVSSESSELARVDGVPGDASNANPSQPGHHATKRDTQETVANGSDDSLQRGSAPAMTIFREESPEEPKVTGAHSPSPPLTPDSSVSGTRPAVRRLSGRLEVSASAVTAGDLGEVSADNVRHAAASNQSAIAGVQPTNSDGYGPIRRERMTRTRQTIARNMLASYATIPQLTNCDDVDVSDLERIRNEGQADFESQQIKLTMLPFVVKATAAALRNHPVINASVSEEGADIIYKECVNIGVAIDTEQGLLVPVINDADRKNIPEIAYELSELANRARAKSLRIESLRGGTFTISNLGAIGGTYSTPIINPPEAAILVMGRSRLQPQFDDGLFQPRLMMPISLTYDHRIVDGAAAARFLNEIKSLLSTPGRLLMLGM